MEIGDFKYNGIPIFEVGFNDFYQISDYVTRGGRLLSKNIEREDLREYYIKKGMKFGIRYEGVLVDMSQITDKL
jgi:hypothetical protein